MTKLKEKISLVSFFIAAAAAIATGPALPRCFRAKHCDVFDLFGTFFFAAAASFCSIASTVVLRWRKKEALKSQSAAARAGQNHFITHFG